MNSQLVQCCYLRVSTSQRIKDTVRFEPETPGIDHITVGPLTELQGLENNDLFRNLASLTQVF